MTPEQMKMNPIKPMIKVKTNEELDTEKGESTKVQDEFTTSEEEEEYSTFSDMSKHDSEFDINVDDTQDEQNTQTPETLQNTQQCMIRMISYMMNMIHQKMKI